MINIIVGTAGHIDHGKTALVRALTGIDTDRLEEEKRRGISIDLGFAHLEAGGVRFGFVDVPGHERFVKNMLAGAGGIDLVMLVVAADESVKPQTREHFAICRLLGLQHGLVVLTKCDVADADMREVARMEVAELVEGSFLAGAPVVEVSARTGQGLDALEAALVRLASHVQQRDAAAPFRLPIDRSFSLRGFGTVVTGTLWAGRISVEDEVEVQPGGHRFRVRGIQVHGGPARNAEPGQRTALNLAGVEASELRRGMMLVPPGLFDSTSAIDCEFHLLPGANPLKHRAPIHFHAGTAEAEAEVRLLAGLKPVEPGATAFVRLLLKEPLPLLPGDRFIARMFSPVITIGGGTVIENHAPLGIRKSEALARLQRLRAAGLPERAALLSTEHPDGIPLAELVRRCGRPVPLPAELQLIQGRVIARTRLAELAAELRETLARFHHASPLQPGMSRAASPVPAPLLDAVLAAAGDIVAEGENLRLASHKLQLKTDEDAALTRMESLFRDAGLAVPAVNDVIAQSGVDPNRARQLLQILQRNQRLIRISPELLYHAGAIAQLRAILAARKGTRFSVPEFKDWTGVSRKYAIPLLEWLDRERLTRREADKRVIL